MRIVEVIENKLSSASQFSKMSDKIFSSRVGERQHKSHLVCRLRITPAAGGEDGFLNLIEMAGAEQSKYQPSHSSDKREAEQTKQRLSGRKSKQSVQPRPELQHSIRTIQAYVALEGRFGH